MDEYRTPSRRRHPSMQAILNHNVAPDTPTRRGRQFRPRDSANLLAYVENADLQKASRTPLQNTSNTSPAPPDGDERQRTECSSVITAANSSRDLEVRDLQLRIDIAEKERKAADFAASNAMDREKAWKEKALQAQAEATKLKDTLKVIENEGSVLLSASKAWHNEREVLQRKHQEKASRCIELDATVKEQSTEIRTLKRENIVLKDQLQKITRDQERKIKALELVVTATAKELATIREQAVAQAGELKESRYEFQKIMTQNKRLNENCTKLSKARDRRSHQFHIEEDKRIKMEEELKNNRTLMASAEIKQIQELQKMEAKMNHEKVSRFRAEVQAAESLVEEKPQKRHGDLVRHDTFTVFPANNASVDHDADQAMQRVKVGAKAAAIDIPAPAEPSLIAENEASENGPTSVQAGPSLLPLINGVDEIVSMMQELKSLGLVPAFNNPAASTDDMESTAPEEVLSSSLEVIAEERGEKEEEEECNIVCDGNDADFSSKNNGPFIAKEADFEKEEEREGELFTTRDSDRMSMMIEDSILPVASSTPLPVSTTSSTSAEQIPLSSTDEGSDNQAKATSPSSLQVEAVLQRGSVEQHGDGLVLAQTHRDSSERLSFPLEHYVDDSFADVTRETLQARSGTNDESFTQAHEAATMMLDSVLTEGRSDDEEDAYETATSDSELGE